MSNKNIHTTLLVTKQEEQACKYLLYTLSNSSIRIAPVDLRSTREDKVLDKEILNIIRSDK